MPIVTADATVEALPVLPIVTVEPTDMVVIPDVSVTPMAETPAPLPLLYTAAFEGNDAPGLTPTTGWTEIQISGGKALQASANASRVFYSESLSSGAVEARFLINAGEAQVIWGDYQASLSADGIVTLTQLNDQAVVASGTANLTPSSWTLLRLDVVGSQIRISVDGVVVVEQTLSTTPAAGQAGFAASAGVLRIDDFAVYGIALQSTPMTAPVVPTLMMPAQSVSVSALPAPVPSYVEYGQAGHPHFVWFPVVGAVSTTIEVNDVCGDGSPIYTTTTSNLDSYQMAVPDPRLLSGEYVYCLKTNDGQDSSVYSASMPLKIAHNILPFDGDIIAPNTPLTLYYYDEGASVNTYKITIDDEPTFTAPYIHESQPVAYGVSQYTAPTISTPGTYYWRVARLTNGTPDEIYSLTSFKFIVGIAGSGPILMPIDGTTINAPVTFTWEPSTAAPSFAPITSYQLHIATHPNFLDAGVKYTVAANAVQKYTFTPPANAGEVFYHVRVMGMNGDQRVTDITTMALLVDTIPPTAPIIWQPDPNATLYVKRPEFMWSSQEPLFPDLITITNDTTQAVVLSTEASNFVSFIPEIDLLPGTYTLSVSAQDAVNTGPASTLTFTIAAPPVPTAVTNLQPANGGSIDQDQFLSWAPLDFESLEYTYDVQVSTGSSFATIVAQATDLSATSYNPAGAAPGVYHWRVRASNHDGVRGPWTSAQVLIVGTTVPKPTLVGVTKTETGRPRFEWQLMSGVSQYQLEVNEVCGDGTPLYQVTVGYTNFHQMPSTARLYQGEYMYCLRGVKSVYGSYASQPFKVIYTIDDIHLLTTSPFWMTVYSVVPDAGQTITYKIYIDDETTFTLPYVHESPIQPANNVWSHYQNLSVPPSGHYYSRAVRYINGVPEPIHSFVYSDLFVGYDGSAPLITSPAPNVTVNSSSVKITWNKSITQPTYGTITHYRIKVSGPGGGATVDFPLDVPQEYVFVPLVNLDDWFYNVTVTGMMGVHTVTSSATRTFDVDTVPPAIPSVTWPTPDADTDQPRPTITWATATGAEKYNIQLLDASTQAELVSVELAKTVRQYTPSFNLLNGSYILRIRSKDNINTSDWVSVPFTVEDAVPPPINSSSLLPASNATMNIVQGLTWAPIANASGGPFTYDVQISGGTDFTALMVDAEGLTETLYLPESTLPDGLYYWRVRAVNQVGEVGPWTIAQQIRLDFTPLAVPVTDPVTSGLVSSGRPYISWKSVSGAMAYEIDINDVCGDGTSLLTKRVGSYSYTMNATDAALPQGDLQYCLKSVDGAGNLSDFSPPQIFTVLYNTSPMNNISSPAGYNFSWNAVAGITGQTITYKLIVDSDPEFAAPWIYESAPLSTASHSIPVGLPVGKLYWRVLRFVNGGQDPVLTSKSFNVTYTASVPTITTQWPAANAITGESSITLAWNAPIPTITHTHYRIEVYQGATNVVDTIVPASDERQYTLTLPNLDNVRYEWRATAVNNGIIASSHSLFTAFYFDNTPPDAPSITWPTPNTVTNQPRPAFIWTSVADARRYTLQILNPETQAVLMTTDVNSPSVASSMPANLMNGDYIIRVRAFDGLHDSAWTSEPFSIRDAVPPPIMGLQPANGRTVNAVQSLSWQDINDASGMPFTYDVQISANANFVPLVVSTSHLTSTTYQPSPFLADGVYWWRVRAVNNVGVLGSWSIQSVTIDRTPLPTPSMMTVYLSYGKPIFQWGNVVGSFKYELEVNDVCGDGSPVLSRSFLPNLYQGYQSYTPDTALIQDDYVVCVRSVDTALNVSAYSVPYPFWVLYSTSPAHNEVTESTNFLWGAGPGLAGQTITYKLLVDDEPTLSLPLVYESEALSVTSLVVPLQPNTRLYWRVIRLVNGVPDPVLTPRIHAVTKTWIPPYVSLLAPTANAAVNGPAVTLRWGQPTPTSAFTGYKLEVYQGTTSIVSEMLSAETQEYVLSVPANQSHLPYQWRVIAMNGTQAVSAYNLFTPFVVDDIAPGAPTITSPMVDAELSDRQITVTWSAGEDAQTYEIEILKASTQEIVLSRQVPADTISYTSAALLNDSYSVRVRSSDGVNTSAWVTLSFSINSSEPDPTPTPEPTETPYTVPAPFVTTPGEASVLNTGLPTISWVNPAGSPAVRYVVELNNVCGDGTPTYNSTEDAAPITKSPYKLLASLPLIAQGQHQICVRAVDANGVMSDYSPPRTIIYNAASSPKNTFVALGGTLRFTVHMDIAASNAQTDYVIQVDTEPTFSPPFLHETSLPATQSTWSVQNTLPAGKYYWRALRRQAGVLETVTSPVYTTFYIGTLAAAPTGLGGTNAVARSTDPFSWTAVMTPPAGVTVWGYILFIESSNPANNGVMYVEGQQTTSVVVPMPPNTQALFNWHVAAIDADKTLISNLSSSYSRIVDDVAPVAPIIISPASNATLSTVHPLFQWSSMDANSYRFAIKNISNNVDVIPEQGINTKWFTPLADLPSGTYELRVRGIDYFFEGPWTTVTFSIAAQNPPLDIPIGLMPANGTTLTDEQPTFSWEAVSQALGYVLQIDDMASFATPLTINTASTSWPPSPLLTLGSYYWRVRALASAGTQSSGWSETHAFVLDSVALLSPVLVTPQNAANIIAQPTFSWGIVPGAEEYKLQIDQASDFPAPTLVSVSTPSYTPSPVLVPGTYYWRAAAVINGHQSNWSTARRFTLYPIVPTAALISPANNSLLTLPATSWSMNVTFKWAAVTGATYTLQIGTDPSFATIEETCSTTALSCTLSGMSAGRYIWRVLVNNAPYGESASFTVSPVAPRAVLLTSPSSGRYLILTERPDVQLTWTWGTTLPAGAPFTYDVEMSPSSTFDILTVSTTGLNTQTFTASALPDGTYYWRARATNAYGVPGAWSTVFSFIVDSVASFSMPVMSSPAANAVLSTARPSFRWSTTTGVYNQTIEINDVCGDNTPIHRNSALITASSYSLTSYVPALPQGSYSVCITAYDRSENALMSVARPFSISLAVRPINGSFVAAPVKPLFEWASATETGKIVTYQIQIDPTGDFAGDDLLTSSVVSGISLVWPTPLPTGSYRWRVVRLVNGVAVDANHSLSQTLFIGALTEGPILTAPEASVVISSPVDLAWTAASASAGLTIDTYEVVTSRISTFSSVISTQQVAADVLSVPFIPSAQQNRVTHYWRVRGLSNGLPVTNWSTRSFIVDNVAPTAPVITVPAANMLINTVRQTITWGAVSSASQYRLSILDAESLNPIVMPLLLTKTSYTPTDNLPQATLIVQIEASDGLNWSPLSTQTFSVRLGTTPAQNAVVTTNRPVFSWIAVPEAAGYTLEVDNNTDFSSPLFKVDVTAPLYTPTVAQGFPIGVYVWRVKAINGDYPTEKAARTFIYGMSLKPLTPVVASGLTLNTPDSTFNASEAATLVFSWRAVTPAPLRFQVDISSSSTFPMVSTLTRTTLTPSLTLLGADLAMDGYKYWRVRGVYSDDTTGYGPWSDVRVFTLDRVAPLPPTLSTPNARITTARPTWTWLASVTASRYILTVIDKSTNQPVPGLEAVSTFNRSYTLSSLQKALKQSSELGYEWSVQAEDAAGNRSAASLTYRFTTAAMITPASGQFVADSTPIFLWTGVAGLGAAPWRLEIYQEPDGGERTLIYTSPDLPAASSSFTLPNGSLLQSGRYSWRVSRPTEDTLVLGYQPFYVVGTLASVTPKQISPTLGQIVKSTVMLSWQPITLAGTLTDVFSGYEVQISPLSTFPGTHLMKHFTAETSLPLSALTGADGIYYWRVAALFSDGSGRSPYSLVRSFKLDNVAPSSPVLNAPVSNAVIIDTTPTLTWAAASGAPVEYILQIENDPQSTSSVYTAVIKAPALMHTLPNASVLSNGRYTWRVVAKDMAGNLSVLTSGRPLMIAAP